MSKGASFGAHLFCARIEMQRPPSFDAAKSGKFFALNEMGILSIVILI